MSTETAAVLRRACEQVGLDHEAAELIRAGENDLYRLPGSVVARISRPGQASAADKELRVTRWLASSQVPAVRPWGEQDAPVVVGDRAVTFWHELPPHEQGSTTDVAGLLRELHSLDPPDGMQLPELAPFVRVAERIDGAIWLDPQDRDWLRKRLAELQDAYRELPAGIPWRLVHGDAWRGNVAATATGPVLMDFERCAYGPPRMGPRLHRRLPRHYRLAHLRTVDRLLQHLRLRRHRLGRLRNPPRHPRTPHDHYRRTDRQ